MSELQEKAAVARLSDLERRIKRQLDDSPLQPIGGLMLEVVASCKSAVEFKREELKRSQGAQRLVKDFDLFLRALPDSFEERYLFDSWLLTTLLQRLADVGTPVSVTATPRFQGVWGYSKILIPLVAGPEQSGRAVHIYHFDGGDVIEDIQLHNYAWLFHEISHGLMRSEAETFRKNLGDALRQLLGDARGQLFGLKGDAKRHQQEHLSKLELFWTPTANQENWAHEIAMDVMALHIAGPCYAHQLHHHANHEKTSLFEIAQGHPPFAARVVAGRIACAALGLTDAEAMLSADCASLVDANDVDLPAAYPVYAREALIVATVRASLECAQALRVPQYDPMIEKEVDQLISRDEIPSDGFLAILAAYKKRRSCERPTYEQWHAAVIETITTQ